MAEGGVGLTAPARYGQSMRSRWRTLMLMALIALLLDQWTKLLAVKHLTPAHALEQLERRTGVKPVKMPSIREQEALVAEMSAADDVRAFFAGTRAPCSSAGARCPSIRVIDGFWSFRYTENPGAAWSIFSTLGPGFRIPLLVSVPLFALLMIALYARSLGEEQRLALSALGVIAGGALGNVVDRLRLGYVIDFIDWYAGSSHWPTFNIADTAISVGIGLLGLATLREPRRGVGSTFPARSNDGLAGPMP